MTPKPITGYVTKSDCVLNVGHHNQISWPDASSEASVFAM